VSSGYPPQDVRNARVTKPMPWTKTTRSCTANTYALEATVKTLQQAYQYPQVSGERKPAGGGTDHRLFGGGRSFVPIHRQLRGRSRNISTD
jgi:hypothetical protein